MGIYSVEKLMSQARKLAADYRKATGQTLAISGEIAKHDAARLLDLEPCADPQCGYDAVGKSGSLAGRRIQIKGRAIFDEGKSGQRIGQLRAEKDWDSVVLVLMDEEFQPREIYEAEREDVMEAVNEAAGSRRSKRGALSVAKFKFISHLVWTQEEGLIDEDLWDNRGDG